MSEVRPEVGSAEEIHEAPGNEPAADDVSATRRTGVLADPVSRRLIIASLVILILWLSAVASALVVGILSPSAPRTYEERELSMLEKSLDREPKNGVLWARYADVLVSAKQYARAESAIKSGLKASTYDKSRILLVDARLARVRKDDDAAIKKADLAIAEAKKEIKATLRRYEDQGIDVINPKVDSKSLDGALLLKAEVYTQEKQWDKAVAAYTDYLKRNPQASDIFVERGDAYAAAGDKAAAEKDYREALKYIPDYKQAIDGLKKIGVAR